MDYQSVNKMKNRMNTSFTKSYLLLLVAIVVSCTFTEPVSRPPFHVNWGWKGDYNGYFLSNLLDFNDKKNDWEMETKGSSESIYDRDMRTITYKKPNWR